MERHFGSGLMENRLSEHCGASQRIDWNLALAEHDRWLRCVVIARTGEAQAVDDVMQNVALAAIRQSAPLDDPAKVAPWLYRLAVRQSLLYRRKAGRRRKLADRYVERGEPPALRDGDADPLDWLLADERGAIVRQALRELPRRDAETLVLKYVECWSYRQLAEHMGLSVSAAEARLHRARKRLRSRLTTNSVFQING